MAQGAKLASYNGNEIYEVDYSGVDNLDSFYKLIEASGKFRDTLAEQGKKDLLMLIDVTGCHIINLELFEVMKKHGKLTKSLIRKSAVVGVNRFRFLIPVFNIFTGMNLRIFENKEEALNWLVKEKD